MPFTNALTEIVTVSYGNENHDNFDDFGFAKSSKPTLTSFDAGVKVNESFNDSGVNGSGSNQIIDVMMRYNDDLYNKITEGADVFIEYQGNRFRVSSGRKTGRNLEMQVVAERTR